MRAAVAELHQGLEVACLTSHFHAMGPQACLSTPCSSPPRRHAPQQGQLLRQKQWLQFMTAAHLLSLESLVPWRGQPQALRPPLQPDWGGHEHPCRRGPTGQGADGQAGRAGGACQVLGAVLRPVLRGSQHWGGQQWRDGRRGCTVQAAAALEVMERKCY